MDNPEKAEEIPTRSGWMRKADTSDDAVAPSTIVTNDVDDEKALHFFETGRKFFFKFSMDRRVLFEENLTGFQYYLRTAFAWICGLEKPKELDGQSVGPHHEIESLQLDSRSSVITNQISSWHHLCSYAAIVLISFCAFVWAFFADYRIRLN